MGRYKKALLGAQLSAFGLALAFWQPSVGAALCAVGVFLGLTAIGELNDPLVRGLSQLGALMYAAVLFMGSGSAFVAASILPFPLLGAPGEIAIRKLGFRVAILWPITAAVGTVVLLLGWPPTLWWFGSAPVLLMGALWGKEAFAWLARFRKQNRSAWQVAVGDLVPDFTLPVRGSDDPFRLSEQRGTHLLVQFTRGDWCPICHVITRVLKKEADRLNGCDVKVVLISPTSGPEADEFVSGLGLPFAVLSDPEHHVAKVFGALDPTAFDGKGAPLPATFVIGADGKLLLASRPDDVATFLDPQDVMRLLGAAPQTA